jgi:type VI secretion system protein ImpM
VTFEAGDRSPGWYGKLPSLGDFARRRLPDDFVQPWDAWLQDVLQATRGALGAAWLDGYLTMPMWRFVIVPGVIGTGGWAGVLTPSVDRVGRHFPLTIAVPLSSYAAVAHAVFDGAGWFEGLEDTALAALDPTCGPEDLDRDLADQLFSASRTDAVGDSGGPLRRLPGLEGFASVAKGSAVRAWAQSAGWSGLWWTRGRIDGDTLMLTCAGLPTAQEFGWLVEGRPARAAGLDADGTAPIVAP